MSKIGRDAFLYLEGGGAEFAQCATCAFRNEDCTRCLPLGKDFAIEPAASCGFYAKGDSVPATIGSALVSPGAAGYLQEEVRCTNCASFDTVHNTCMLFDGLNQAVPDHFALDTSVSASGCCNAWNKKTEKAMTNAFAEVFAALLKAGARHGKTDRQYLAAAHDAVAALVDKAHCAQSAMKANQRHSKVDHEKIKKVHDLLIELGASCQ